MMGHARAALVTVTFLFTDIEGSTSLLHELGAGEYAESLAQHRRLLREAFASHGGVEVDTQGDPSSSRSPTPGRRSPRLERRRRRSGRTGSRPDGASHRRAAAERRGLRGVDVHKAARICSAGHGGQVLVSERTKLAVEEGDLLPLGLHRLRI